MADFTVEGIIDVDATKGIASVKSFRKQLDGLFTDLKKVDAAISKVDGRSIDIDVDVASSELEKLRTDLEAIDDLKATVDLDTTAAQVEAAKLAREIDSIGGDVSIGFENIEDELAAINAEIDAIQDVQIDVDIDRHKALIQAEKLRAEVDAALGDVEMDVHVDTDDIDSAKKEIDGLTSAVGGAGGLGTGGLIAALVLLASTAGPIGGVLAGMTAAAGGSLGVLVTGIGALGALSVPILKDMVDSIKLLATNTEELSPEKLKEYHEKVAEMKKSNPNIWEAAQAFNSLSSNYKKFSDALRPELIAMFTEAFVILNTLLGYAAPIADRAADAFVGLFGMMSDGLKGDDWKAFFAYVEENIFKFINQWGKAVGNFLTGIANMIRGTDPLTKFFNRGWVELSRDFLEWSRSFSKSQGFKDFVAFVKENGPLVKSVLGGLIMGIINLAKNLAPLGTHVLEVVDGFLDWYNNLTKTSPKTAKFVTIVAAFALAMIPLVGYISSIIPLLTVVFGILAGVSTVAAVVAAFVGLGAAVAFLNPQTEHFKGMMQSLKDLWTVIVDVGQRLWQVLKDLWAMLEQSGAVDDLQKGFTSLFNILQVLLPLLVPLAQLVGTVLVLAFAMAAKAFMGFMKIIETAVNIIEPVINWIVDAFQWLFDKLVGHSIIPDLVNGIITWIKKLPGRVIGILTGLVTSSITWFGNLKDKAIAKAGELLTGFVTKIVNLRTQVLNRIDELKANAINKLSGIKDSFVTWAANIVAGFITKFNDIKSKSITKLIELRSSVTGFFSGALSWLTSAGANIIQGLIDGITGKLGTLKDTVSSAAGWVKDHWPFSPVKEGPLKALNYSNPGENFVNMIIDGIKSRESDLVDAAFSLTKSVPLTMDNGEFFNDASTGAAYGTVVNKYYDVDVTVPVGANLAEAGREIAEALDAYEGIGGRRQN